MVLVESFQFSDFSFQCHPDDIHSTLGALVGLREADASQEPRGGGGAAVIYKKRQGHDS